MKRFNSFSFILSVSLGIISVSSRNVDSIALNCDIEQRELKRQYDSCAPNNFKMLQIADDIKQFRDQSINGTEFSRIITSYCVTLKNASSCSIEKATTISVNCRDYVTIQFFVNFMRIINRATDDLCSEEVIFAIAGDKGFNCLDTRGLGNCMHRKLSNQEAGGSLKDKNVCQTTQFLHSCNNEIFDVCENDGILKNYTTQMLNGVRQDFSCD